MKPTQLLHALLPLAFAATTTLAAADPVATETAFAVIPSAPGAAFLQGENLTFSRRPDAQFPAEWTLRNWKGETLRQGKWANGKAAFQLETLPNGYYTLELRSSDAEFTGSRSFAVLPDPAKREKNPDMPYALDSAQSWLARVDKKNPHQPNNAFEIVSEVARRSGTQMVRERLKWKDVQAKPGKINWKLYKTNADFLSARGITILGLYHDAPEWAGTKGTRLPGDLVEAYNFAKHATEGFRGQMTAWEFWNEPALISTTGGAWDFASAQKASYLGFKAADPDLPVTVGSLPGFPSASGYADSVMRSGTGEYFDIFNSHSYHRVRDIPDMIADVRAHLERHGLEKRPIWFSEVGTRIDGPGQQVSLREGLKEHSPEQELLIAELLPKTLIHMQLAGVTRNFFFVLPPYNEYRGNKDWGLMRRDYTVKPGLAAFATLVDRLGAATPEGEVDLGDQVKGFLFRQKDGSKTLVYWHTSAVDNGRNAINTLNERPERTFSLPKQDGIRKGVDLFGSPFETDGGSLTATRFPAYLDRVTGLTVSVPFQIPELEGALPKRDLDKTIIFQTRLSDDFAMFPDKSGVDLKQDNAKFTLQVWNLSTQVKTGVVTGSGGTVTGLPATVSVPPFGKTELELTYTARIDRNFEGELRIDGVFGGQKTTPLVIPVQSKLAMVKTGQVRALPQLEELSRWRKNSAGKLTITRNEAEHSLEFHTVFALTTPDRWSYPEFVLRLPEESLKGIRGIGFEVKVSNAADVKQMLVMPVMDQEQEGGTFILLKMDHPSEQWEERFVQFPPGADPGKIKQLRIGLNSTADDIRWQIRNVRVYYAAP